MSLASLAMYDFAHLREHWQDFYALTRRCASFLPEELQWGSDAYDWGGDVALSMTCGAPLRNQLSKHLHVIGALDFGLGQKGQYRSVILGRVLHGKTKLAINDFDSQSGFHAPMHFLNSDALDIVISGSHLASIQMLLSGEADLCGVDEVSFKFISDLMPEILELPIIGYTSWTPGLPLVTSHEEWVVPIQQAIRDALPHFPEELRIVDLIEFKLDDYVAVPNFDRKLAG